jgi:hypothetical protein
MFSGFLLIMVSEVWFGSNQRLVPVSMGLRLAPVVSLATTMQYPLDTRHLLAYLIDKQTHYKQLSATW